MVVCRHDLATSSRLIATSLDSMSNRPHCESTHGTVCTFVFADSAPPHVYTDVPDPVKVKSGKSLWAQESVWYAGGGSSVGRLTETSLKKSADTEQLSEVMKRKRDATSDAVSSKNSSSSSSDSDSDSEREKKKRKKEKKKHKKEKKKLKKEKKKHKKDKKKRSHQEASFAPPPSAVPPPRPLTATPLAPEDGGQPPLPRPSNESGGPEKLAEVAVIEPV